MVWTLVYSGRSGYSGHPQGVQNLDALGTLDGTGTLDAWITLDALGVQTRAVLINCCIPKHVEMV